MSPTCTCVIDLRSLTRRHRDEAESGLRFLGLIIFENKLKPGTTPVIHTLRHARIGTRMCTGDNVRTAVSVGRECGMVPEHARVYIPAFVSGDQMTARSELEWTDVEDSSYKLDSYGLMVCLFFGLREQSTNIDASLSFQIPTRATTKKASAKPTKIGLSRSLETLSDGLLISLL